MPTISRFYGITIAIYFNDHAPPHFHARYAEHEVQIRIADGAVMEGALPPRAMGLVRKWYRRYNVEIARSWEQAQRTGVAERVPPLE
jgi:hypothetical protein